MKKQPKRKLATPTVIVTDALSAARGGVLPTSNPDKAKEING